MRILNKRTKVWTAKTIQGFKFEGNRRTEWEPGRPGFGVRLGAKKRSWVFQYRFKGSKKLIVLGNYPNMGLSEAHSAHAKAVELLESGKDPVGTKKKKEIEIREALTVRGLGDEYIERYARPNKKSWADDERRLKSDVTPFVGRLKARDITKRHIIKLLDKLIEKGSPISANRLFALLRKMFNFAIERDIIKVNPCAGISKPAKERPRERTLTENEIKTFWAKLDETTIPVLLKYALKLQLILLQRPGEIRNAEWVEFDFVEKVWTIPAPKTKNGSIHRVPLSDMALDILNDIRTLSGNYRWVFPSPRKRGSAFGKTSVAHLLKKNMSIFQFDEPFTGHDLRRSGTSIMASMGILRPTVKRVLNHIEKDVTDIYDRYSYDREKRMALDTWARKLDSIITGERGNVIPFHLERGGLVDD